MKTRTLALVAGVALVAGASVAGASTPLPNATGTIHCSVKGSVKYNPPLHSYAAPDTTPTLVTLTTTEYGCTATGTGTNITGGGSKTSHTVNSNDCLTVLTAPFVASSGTLKWKVVSHTQKWASSTISFTSGSSSPTDPPSTDQAGSSTAGSYNGDAATAHAQIKETLAKITAKCTAGQVDPLKGLKSLTITTGSTFDLS